jgi:hypothetical protein
VKTTIREEKLYKFKKYYGRKTVFLSNFQASHLPKTEKAAISDSFPLKSKSSNKSIFIKGIVKLRIDLIQVPSKYPGDCFMLFHQSSNKISCSGIFVFFSTIINIFPELDNNCFMIF